MDTDAFSMTHQQQWDRLEYLSKRRRLSAAEIDELVDLYQRCTTHLSQIRSTPTDPGMVIRLTRTISLARAALSPSSASWWQEVQRLALVSFPAAVWRIRWWALGAALATTVIAVTVGLWVASNADVMARIGTPEELDQLVNHEFEDYYHADSATAFAAQLWTHNAWICALCFIVGITGIGVPYLLWQNAMNIGISGGVMAAYGKLDVFFGLITPHGLLELTAVFIAAAAGMRLFWAWVAPGPMSRADSLGREGRSMTSVVLGLVAVLLVSGIIEAFVTPSPLPTAARILIGAMVWIAFLAYVVFYGRRAAAAGETGDIDAELLHDTVPVAA